MADFCSVYLFKRMDENKMFVARDNSSTAPSTGLGERHFSVVGCACKSYAFREIFYYVHHALRIQNAVVVHAFKVPKIEKC